MHEPDVIVYERAGRWAAGLKLALACSRRAVSAGSGAACLAEARSLAEVSDLLQNAKTGLVVLELALSNAPRIVDFVAHLDDRHPNVKNVVVSRSRDRHWDLAARWAGAMLYVTSLAELAPVAELVERAVERRLVRGRETATKRMWAALPWSQ